MPSICVNVRQRRIFADKSSIGSKNPAHELTNNWTTRRERSFRALCARPRPATDQSCPSDCRNSSRSDVGQRSGAYHRGRTQHLDVATRFRPRRLKSFSCSFGAHATVVASQSAGTSTYDRSSSAVDAQPSNLRVRMRSVRRISIDRATPEPPAAPSPYA
jgi:hypothetical protein